LVLAKEQSSCNNLVSFMAAVLVFNQRVLHKAFQQSVHPTLGILRIFQAFSYTFSFFCLDGFSAAHPSAGNANR